MKVKRMCGVVLAVLLSLGLTFVNVVSANPVHLTGPVWIGDTEQVIINEKKFLKVPWKITEKQDWWADNYVAVCPDPRRDGCDGNVPFKVRWTSETTGEYLIPWEVIEGGQSAFNLAGNEDWFNADWTWIPDCTRVHFNDKDWTYYMSNPDPNIKKSGGMQFLYIGPGAPFIPKTEKELALVYKCVEPEKTSAPVSDDAAGAAKTELADLKRQECDVTLKGDMVRTEVLLRIISAYWNVDVETKPGKGHEVIVTGAGGTRSVSISNELLGKLNKLVGNPNAGDSLNSLCPEQAKLIREAIGNCK